MLELHEDILHRKPPQDVQEPQAKDAFAAKQGLSSKGTLISSALLSVF
jgi:hypothetical protein